MKNWFFRVYFFFWWKKYCFFAQFSCFLYDRGSTINIYAMTPFQELLSLTKLYLLSECEKNRSVWVEPALAPLFARKVKKEQAALPQPPLHIKIPEKQAPKLIPQTAPPPPPKIVSPPVTIKEEVSSYPRLVPQVPCPQILSLQKKPFDDSADIQQVLSKLFAKIKARTTPLREERSCNWKKAPLYPDYAFVHNSKQQTTIQFITQVVEAVGRTCGSANTYEATEATFCRLQALVSLKAVIFVSRLQERFGLQWIESLGATKEQSGKVVRCIGRSHIPFYEVILPDNAETDRTFKAALWKELKSLLG